MDNTTVINTFNSDKSNMTYIKTQHRQIIATIGYRILKFELMIKNQQWQIMQSLLLLLLATSIPSPKSILS